MPDSSERDLAAATNMLRATLYGDAPLAAWVGTGQGEPWQTFVAALRCQERDDSQGMIRALQSVVGMQGLESRHYLQAWHALRESGVRSPLSEARHVYGVVVDLPSQTGLDTLAAYEDHRARYINFTGKVIIWEAADEEINGLIDDLIDVGQSVAERIGPWEGARPPLPRGQARISLLTPSGIHFGQGPPALLFQDATAKSVLDAAARVLSALVQRATTDRQ